MVVEAAKHFYVAALTWQLFRTILSLTNLSQMGGNDREFSIYCVRSK